MLSSIARMPAFHRKPNRLPMPSYIGFQQYFLTICTHRRKKLFYNVPLVHAVLTALQETAAASKFGISAYCFMPDHLHLLVQAQSKTSYLTAFMKSFKGISTSRARKLGERELWHKGYYDHILRDTESAAAAAWYIFQNLVRHAKNWPFAGSLLFDWKGTEDLTRPYFPPWKTQNQPLAI